MSPTMTEAAQTLTIQVGAAQRAMGGLVRMTVETDGEVVVGATPLMGCVHRGVEKLAEEGPYARVLPLLACAGHLGVTHSATAFSMALEQLADVRVPAKASWLRALAMEVERAASHLTWLAAWTHDAGLPRAAAVALRDAKAMAGALDTLTCAYAGRGYIMPGGVAVPTSAETLRAVDELLETAEGRAGEIGSELDRGGAFARFAHGLGASDRESCEQSGTTGPCLRACGAARDARRYLPVQPYPRVELAVPLGSSGDCWDRCYVRLEETAWAVRIARELIAGMPGGPHSVKVDADIVPPAGEAYAAVESPRGELGVHIVSDGSVRPYRLRLRSPSFYNLGAAGAALVGASLEAAPFILGSFDLMAGEMER